MRLAKVREAIERLREFKPRYAELCDAAESEIKAAEAVEPGANPVNQSREVAELRRELEGASKRNMELAAQLQAATTDAASLRDQLAKAETELEEATKPVTPDSPSVDG